MTWKFWKRKAKVATSAAEFNLDAFQARLRGLAGDDALNTQMEAWLTANVWTETGAAVSAGLDDSEAHRLRGRVGMVLDLREEWRRQWDITHPAPVQTEN